MDFKLESPEEEAARLAKSTQQVSEGKSFDEQGKPVAVKNKSETFNVDEYYDSGKVYVYKTQLSFGKFPETVTKRGLEGVKNVLLSQDTLEDSIIRQTHANKGKISELAFTPDQIADLIDAQPNGHDGELLIDNKINLFFCENNVTKQTFLARVSWDTNQKQWVLVFQNFDQDTEWPAGTKVFFNTLAK